MPVNSSAVDICIQVFVRTQVCPSLSAVPGEWRDHALTGLSFRGSTKVSSEPAAPLPVRSGEHCLPSRSPQHLPKPGWGPGDPTTAGSERPQWRLAPSTSPSAWNPAKFLGEFRAFVVLQNRAVASVIDFYTSWVPGSHQAVTCKPESFIVLTVPFEHKS